MHTDITTPPIAFQLAVEAKDSNAVTASLATDVVFQPPIQFQAFHGRDLVRMVLSIPATVFAFTDTFRYANVLTNGTRHALCFEAELPSGHSL